MIMTIDVNAARIPERISAAARPRSMESICCPLEKTLENGKKLIDFRADATVKEIHRLMATTTASAR